MTDYKQYTEEAARLLMRLIETPRVSRDEAAAADGSSSVTETDDCQAREWSRVLSGSGRSSAEDRLSGDWQFVIQSAVVVRGRRGRGGDHRTRSFRS